MDAVLLRQLQDARPTLVVGDQLVDLAGGEKGLNRLDSPQDRAAMVIGAVFWGRLQTR
ncbi:hypothetical protein [Changpingibacter yushuensis]|uniref:hypothetical protein n=1 Tax=Changpingibacter yushuensis TaxID=2758440 RepID=UPI00165DD367|nr:hypothetical protein [Changpingibacter yushuensis]